MTTPVETKHSALARPVALAAVLLERYVLSFVFLYLAYSHWHRLTTHSGPEYDLVRANPLIEILRQVIWMQFYTFTGVMLLIARRATLLPQSAKDILVPLVTTFFGFSYEAIPWFPAGWRTNLCPPPWQGTCVTIGLVLNLTGLVIGIWAALSLGRSFGVIVAVRTVIVEGAYRWVRHPIYFGYLFFFAGLVAANCSPALLLLAAIQVILLAYRARLEEARLIEASPDYVAYQKRTGFIFPKL